MAEDGDSPRIPGRLVETIDGAKAFVPDRLPVGLILPPEVGRVLGDARASLGALGAGVAALSKPDLLIRPFQKREAVLSSRIEGTRTTLEEAFVEEAAGLSEDSDDDAREVRNYEHALHLGIQDMAAGQPLTLHLLRALHRELLAGVRGEDKRPGEFRSDQVWLGGPASRGNIQRARFIPPPPLHLTRCLQDFESWLSDRRIDDPLVRVALAHYQFETIHPFLDGNGRVGRLLIVLQMIHEGLLDQPWLYVSPFLENERESYYALLHRVSERGDWIEWVRFFLHAVIASARETMDRLSRLRDLETDFHLRLADLRTQKPLQLCSTLFALPYVTVPIAQHTLQVATPKTAQTAIDYLVNRRILEPIDWKPRMGRGRPPTVYRCTEIVNIVRE